MTLTEDSTSRLFMPAQTRERTDHPAMNRDADGEQLLAELYRRYQQPLRKFVLRLTAGDQHLAEDIVQETMLRAWRNATVLDPDRAAMPWLATVARRIVIDHRRRQSSRPDEVAEVSEDMLTDEESDRILESVLVSDALQDLTSAHREALTETILRGRTVRQAAEVLQIPIGTVKSRVYFALRALKVVLEERGIHA
jgi:RNA polymerase sigma factor (sigma-70 family)